MKTKTILLALSLGLSLARVAPAQDANRSDHLVLHEWGTFTVLQDEAGRSIAGVNINEESLPNFVHRLAQGLAPDSPELGPLLSEGPYNSGLLRSKGIPRFYPAVTMRMETPIIYLYPPSTAELPLRADIEVQFRRGWISEWYPQANNEAPGFKFGPNENTAGHLGPDTIGRIRWDGLAVGVKDADLPKTSDHVWLAPRQVPAAAIRNGDGESEQYLFYRGVANLEAPLSVIREANDELHIRANSAGAVYCPADQPLSIAALWLTDIRPDGTIAFRELGAMNAARGLNTPGHFGEKEYSLQQRDLLRASMRREVMRAGLYSAEADALLNTWEASYFKSGGMRVFFVVPRRWTDSILPLTVSPSANIERVMIGRIELVTPQQRALLKKMASLPSDDQGWFLKPLAQLSQDKQFEARRHLLEGKRTLADYGIEMPEKYRTYLALGRFRDALVLDAAHRESSASLNDFAEMYGLRYFSATQ